MKLKWFLVLIALVFGLQPLTAHASFHLMQIEQVIGGVDGDVTAQAIQLRMRLGLQNLVQFSRVVAWDAAGANPVVLVVPPTNVPGSAAGDRVLIASANFANATSPAANPDFVMTNLIPASYLAAGSITFENTAGTIVYWRLSFGGGGYTGSNMGDIANDADGRFGPPFPGPLQTADTQAVRFQGAAADPSTTNMADYALTGTDAIFTNNAGDNFTVQSTPTGIPTVVFEDQLLQNSPNPFNPSTEIDFVTRQRGHVTLNVFDAKGNLVRTLVDQDVPAGHNRASWDGRNSNGHAVASGVFFYRLATRDAVQTRKMVLLK